MSHRAIHLVLVVSGWAEPWELFGSHLIIAPGENTKRLHEYCPEGTELSAHSQDDVEAVARQLNGRPRQTLGWMKPCEVFANTVAFTG